jgi:hypothetical protein
MRVKLLSMAREQFSSPYVSEELNRRNQLAWARSVASMGDKWALAHEWTLEEIKREKKCRCKHK